MKILLIGLLAIVFYTYLGYGIVLIILSKIKSRSKEQQLPTAHTEKVTFLIAAYNEEYIIKKKIENTMNLDYPEALMDITIVTDGSDDNTNAIIAKYPKINLEFQVERKGKIHAVNRIMKYINTPITIFSDANVMLNKRAIKNLVRHFSKKQVGAVSGEKKVWSAKSDRASAAGEGLYWRYESLLKRLDAKLNTLVGAAGELFAVRTKLYVPVNENTIIEDFFITLNIAIKRYKVAYEPKAIAFETASASMKEEEKRKIRISSGGVQAIMHFIFLLNIFKYGFLSFQYISHRVLRWSVAPLALPLIFTLNYFLYNETGFWSLLFWSQIIFYLCALIGYFMKQQKIKWKLFFIPYYFVFMNTCVYKGWVRFFLKSQNVVWEKAQRIKN